VIAARRSRDDISGETKAWWVFTIIILCLGIGKRAEIQTVLIQIGRSLAINYGWYGARRLVQAVFAAVMLLVTLLGALELIRREIRFSDIIQA
jgi:uncharacterized membrane protein